MTQPLTSETFQALTRAMFDAISQVIDGKPDQVERTLITLLAEGHLLIEDVPGVGKTQLARALSAAVSAQSARIQFTPDLLPGDVTGVSVFHPVTREFEFKPGAIFHNIVIADEINRSSPKTQSALLEAMAEGQVTVDGITRALDRPFLVVATQNPLEMEGTYALPEAQRDRFMMRISMGYPDPEAEALMLRQRDTSDPLSSVRAVVTTDQVLELIRWARGIHVSPAAEQYAVALVGATRNHRLIALGASPRATIQLVRAAKARAALEGRTYVLPDDVTALFLPVLAHRIILTREARTGLDEQVALERIVTDIMRSVPVPVVTAG